MRIYLMIVVVVVVLVSHIAFGKHVGQHERFALVLKSLTEYKLEHGHLHVPYKWKVPENNIIYSRETWGFNLGSQVNSIRMAKAYSDLECASELDMIGFVWSASDTRMNKNFMRFCEALETYNELNRDDSDGGKRLPTPKYVVPNEMPFSTAIQGYHLGRKVAEVQRGVIFRSPSYQDKLRQLGLPDFKYNNRKKEKFLQFCRCLLHYKKLNGHLKVPQKFVCSEEWEESFQGIRLGSICANVRGGRIYDEIEYAQILDQIGFVWDCKRK